MRTNYPVPVWWVVLSPEYESGGYDWYDPPEIVRDVMFVFSRSKKTAKILATRAWRRGRWKGLSTRITKNKHGKPVYPRKSYITEYDDENPMAVLTVERPNLL